MMYLKEVNKIFKYINSIRSSFMMAFLFIVVDFLNIPTQLINKDAFLTSVAVCFFGILIILDLILSKKYNLVIAKNINILDKKVFCYICSLIIYSFYLIIDFKIYKIVTILIMVAINAFLLMFRMIYIQSLIKKRKEANSNSYDLKEFLEKDIKKNENNSLILFNEIDVKYDLLNRKIFINYIESLIKNCNPQRSFVFALNGAWGSGKTTILNLVKNKINSDDIIIIDDFDPWKYNDNETMFRGFYDSITKNKNFDFDYSLYKKFYNIYKVLILGNDNILNKLNFDIHFPENDYSVDELKNIISSYLTINNKKVVYIIDNIDRLNKEQILTIFKTISTLFDFNNFIYILSFDEKRVNKIFEKELKIDADYLNKIINSSINLPKTNSDTISKIAVDSIIKLFDYYNITISASEKTRFLGMFSYLSKKIVDIRELKRFLNYISAYMQSEYLQEQVNIGDFIIIQLLKYLNIELYDTIYKNSIFFVSEDTGLCTNYTNKYFFSDNFNKFAKEFYNDLLENSKNEEYKNILSSLFPYVDNYLKGYDIRTTITYNHNQDMYNDSVLNKRIFNGRYFEHYFELTPNQYSVLLKDVNYFVKSINSTKDKDKIELYYKQIILSDIDNQRFKLEILNNSLDKINKDKLMYLVSIIYDNINNINVSSNGATMLGTRERCILILSDIFNQQDLKISKEQIKLFINSTNYLRDIDELIYWLNPDKQYQRNLDNELYEVSKNTFIDKLDNIIKNEADILAIKYGNFSIIILKKYFADIEKIKNYIKMILNKNNIFRFLRNFVSEWIGSGYSYEFNEKALYELISKEEINKIIQLVDYGLNEEQQRILDIYNNEVERDKSFIESINYENL